MKRSKYNISEIDDTAKFRAALSFLQFIETKLLKKQSLHIGSQDMKEIERFSQFVTLYARR